VWHRDIKPANVFLPKDGQPAAKLGDFGIARKASVSKTTGVFRGTPEFAAPETALADPEFGAASDVYSLGGTLFALFTNDERAVRPETPTPSGQDYLRAQVGEEARVLRDVNRDVPEDVSNILRECLFKDPRRRPPATEVLAVLEATKAAALGKSSAQTAAIPTNRRPLTRRQAVAAAVLAVGLGVGALALRSGRAPAKAQEVAVAATHGTVDPAAPTSRSTSPAATTLPAAFQPTPVPAAPIPATTASPAVEKGPGGPRRELVARLREGMVEISNGEEMLKDAEVVLVGKAATYKHTIEGWLEPGTTELVSLDDFSPTPPTGEAFREIRVSGSAAKGAKTFRVALK
jgi:hypothetical protein